MYTVDVQTAVTAVTEAETQEVAFEAGEPVNFEGKGSWTSSMLAMRLTLCRVPRMHRAHL